MDFAKLESVREKCHVIVKQHPSTWYFIFKFRFLQKSLEGKKLHGYTVLAYLSRKEHSFHITMQHFCHNSTEV